MADEHQAPPDDEPTRVAPAGGPPSGSVPGSPSGTPAAAPSQASDERPVEHIDVPHSDGGRAAAEAAAAQAAQAAAAAAAAASAALDAGSRPAGPDQATSASGSSGPGVRERTAEGAKAAADRASSAASATVQALRETDVKEIAEHTTSLIENTRPFFLSAFAVAFAFLAAVENHAAIGVTFGIGAVLCVLGAAYSREIDLLLTGRAEAGTERSRRRRDR